MSYLSDMQTLSRLEDSWLEPPSPKVDIEDLIEDVSEFCDFSFTNTKVIVKGDTLSIPDDDDSLIIDGDGYSYYLCDSDENFSYWAYSKILDKVAELNLPDGIYTVSGNGELYVEYKVMPTEHLSALYDEICSEDGMSVIEMDIVPKKSRISSISVE